MNPNNKYKKSQNTMGYLSLSKHFPMYKKTPTKKISHTKKASQIRYSSKTYKNNEITSSIINNDYQFFTKYISKKKFRGVLDMASPNNKDVLIDSDSEVPSTIKERNSNNCNKKKGCTKLVIEKVESQMPKRNEEYYKFTNQKRFLNKNKTTIFTKKNYLEKNILLNNLASRYDKEEFQRNNNSNELNALTKTQILEKKYNYKGSSNNSIKKNYKNSSANNIFNQNYNEGKSNQFYNTGFSYKKHNNSLLTNKNNILITNSPHNYIKSMEDINVNVNDNSLNNNKNYNIYENEKTEINYYPNISFQNKTGTRFYYINKNKNLLLNKDIDEESKRNSLYENYKGLIKMNTFSKISQNNNKNYAKFMAYPGFNENLIKIQSAWRGAYVRELMTFYWNLNNFKNILIKVVKNHLKGFFLKFINLLNKQNCKNNNLKQKYIFVNSKIKEDKTLEEYKKILNQKEEDYENLLKNYNSLVERCTELQQIVNPNNNIKNNDSGNKNKKNIIWKELNIDSSNNAKYEMKYFYEKNNNDKIKVNKIIRKKFDIIKPELKDKFQIIKQNNINHKINNDKDINSTTNGNNSDIYFK